MSWTTHRHVRSLLLIMLTGVELAACGGAGTSQKASGNPSAQDPDPVVESPSQTVTTPELAVKLSHESMPLLENLNIPVDAADRGMWVGPIPWPLIAIHASVLPDGKILTFGSPVNTVEQGARVFDFWDPAYAYATDAHYTANNAQGVDSFCAASAWTSRRKLLISGGNSPRESSILDPNSDAVTRSGKLSSDRWYGSMITLADGRQLMTGGADSYISLAFEDPDAYDDGIVSDVNDRVAMTPEIFSSLNGWSKLRGARSRAAFGPDLNRYWYPRQWVAADGKVFGLSTEQMWRLDPLANEGTGQLQLLGKFKGPVDDEKKPNVGASSSAVMFDQGRILQTGGNGYVNGASSPQDNEYTYRTPSSRQATVIDLGNGSIPTLYETSAMIHARQWHHATVLSDGQVFVNGGTRFANYAGREAVYEGEIWSPRTHLWRETAPASEVRLYHSSAVLMPSGAVFTAGTGAPGPIANFNAEVFLPPYLFSQANGTTTLAIRPKIVALSTKRPQYGETLGLDTDSADSIKEVAILALGNDTHSFNASQRRLGLEFTQHRNRINVLLPSSGKHAPPGYYFLTVLNEHGVPSVGIIISLYAD